MPFKYNPFTSSLDEVVEINSSTVIGPGSSTDDALVRWDGATGTLVQNSNATLTDAGTLTLADPLDVTSGGTGASTASDARTNLGLGSISTQDSSLVSITGGSITGITDLKVADGGTGRSTATPYAVIAGGITPSSPLQSVQTTGLPGQILTSNGDNLMPSFQNLSGIKASDSFSIDAFGRWRVSNPETLFDSKNIFDDPGIVDTLENQPLIFDNQETSGSGTSTSLRINEACQRITVANTTPGTRVRQSKQRFNYQPGKSQEILVTFNMISLNAGITKRAGYYDDNNGVFLSIEGTSVYLVRRTYATGSAVDNKVAQISWNIDKLNGTGSSGITLDFTKTQILFLDFEWLGVGRVRMGFVVDGLIYYAHEFLNANNLNVVYMSTPNLPIRYEISNDGTGAESNLDTICSSVISEGGEQALGVIRSASVTNFVNANVDGTTYACLGIRLKSAYIGKTIKLVSTSLMEIIGAKDLEWDLRLNPTVAGEFTYNDETNSALQVASGATANTVVGGIIINKGYFSSGQGGTGGNLTQGLNSALSLGSTISGTVDTMVLCVTPRSSASADVFAALTWQEI